MKRTVLFKTLGALAVVAVVAVMTACSGVTP